MLGCWFLKSFFYSRQLIQKKIGKCKHPTKFCLFLFWFLTCWYKLAWFVKKIMSFKEIAAFCELILHQEPQFSEFWVFSVNFLCQNLSLLLRKYFFYSYFEITKIFYNSHVLLTLNFEVHTWFSKCLPNFCRPTLCQFTKYINFHEGHSSFW